MLGFIQWGQVSMSNGKELREAVDAIATDALDGALGLAFGTNPEDADDEIPQVVGRYKLLERIGEGGFGVVYMAEQQEPIRRRVALKIIKLGMDTRQVVARFEAERQALALMDHENITARCWMRGRRRFWSAHTS